MTADRFHAHDGAFAIRFDQGEAILHMRLVGFWTLDTLAAYASRVLLETGRLRQGGQRFDILTDSREFAIQSAEVTAGFDELSKRGAGRHTGRTAVVVGSTLCKLQAGRALQASHVKVFLDMEQAKLWLLSEREHSAG